MTDPRRADGRRGRAPALRAAAALAATALATGTPAAAAADTVAAPLEAGITRGGGRVTGAGGEPVPGALVTFGHRELRRATTVYTDPAGRFALPPLEPGAYDLQVRRHGYRDLARTEVTLGPGAALALRLEPEPDPFERAWQLPANRWLALLLRRLSSDAHREELVRQCTFCHQQGSWATRVPRSPEDWDKIFKLMARMGGVLSPGLRAELPAAFNAAYDDEAAVAALDGEAPVPPSAEAARAVVTEWIVGHPASMQHDVAVHPDGRVYSVDFAQDQLYRLDPATGARAAWDVPRGTSPLGGVFHGSGMLLAPNARSHVAPHSLQVAPDGAIWMTLALGNKLARFDPASEYWNVYRQETGLYPHTLRFDARGRIWYTLAVSNHLGMLDPATGERRTVRLPARTWRQAVATRLMPAVLFLADYLPLDAPAGSEGIDLPVPYGIDVAPDGGVWFSQLNVHRIGRYDPVTGATRLVDTPFPAPRRLRFDSQGRLWIPGFSAGVLARFEPATGAFTTWPLPIEPAGSETPYALNVDRRTDTVWICGTNSDTLIRFEPGPERFTVYPLPTRVTYTREIDFDARGAVWTSNSNFPAWQIEGPGPQLIRLEPEGLAAADATAPAPAAP
jgi:virginiamycin B lyase